MSYRVAFSARADADLNRLYDFILERDPDGWTLAEQARVTLVDSVKSLERTPFSFRKATPSNSFLREMVVPFGATGFVVLFEVFDQHTVVVLAIRHQREDDFF